MSTTPATDPAAELAALDRSLGWTFALGRAVCSGDLVGYRQMLKDRETVALSPEARKQKFAADLAEAHAVAREEAFWGR